MKVCINIPACCLCMSLLLIETTIVSGQSAVQVSATADSSRIMIGSQFHLQLTAKQKALAGWRINFPIVADTFNHFEVVSRSKIDTVTDNSSTTYTQTITLTSFDSGYWQIPPFRFDLISNSSGQVSTDSSAAIGIAVNTVAVDTTQPFKPIKSLRSVPWSWRDYLKYILFGIGILALLIILFLYFRHKPKKTIPTPAPSGETPYERALKKLKQLEQEKTWQQGQVKLYYSNLSDTMREYVAAQYGIMAMEQTTDEFLRSIREIPILNQQKEKWQHLLQTADLVKFAKLQPLPEEHVACLQLAYEILEWTKPRTDGNHQNQ